MVTARKITLNIKHQKMYQLRSNEHHEEIHHGDTKQLQILE